jgi:hypothetical protein
MDSEIVTVIFLGPARWILPLGARFVGTAFKSMWGLLCYTSLFQFGWQFLYRYLGVCRDWRMPFRAYIACTLCIPLYLAICFLFWEWVPANKLNLVQNPVIVEVLGMPLPPPEGFALRVKVSVNSNSLVLDRIFVFLKYSRFHIISRLL